METPVKKMRTKILTGILLMSTLAMSAPGEASAIDQIKDMADVECDISARLAKVCAEATGSATGTYCDLIATVEGNLPHNLRGNGDLCWTFNGDGSHDWTFPYRAGTGTLELATQPGFTDGDPLSWTDDCQESHPTYQCFTGVFAEEIMGPDMRACASIAATTIAFFLEGEPGFELRIPGPTVMDEDMIDCNPPL